MSRSVAMREGIGITIFIMLVIECSITIDNTDIMTRYTPVVLSHLIVTMTVNILVPIRVFQLVHVDVVVFNGCRKWYTKVRAHRNVAIAGEIGGF